MNEISDLITLITQ